MDNQVKIARIGAISVIIAAIIGGLFAIVPTIIENDKLKKDYEELQSKNLELIAQQNILQENYDSIKEEYDDLNKNYISLQDQYATLEKEYKDLLQYVDSININDDLLETDRKEVNEINEILCNFQNENFSDPYFANISTDMDAVELFYKTQICMRYYKYSNIIIAFKECKIECESLEITEEILELWDIEMLYIYYQMLENLEKSENKNYLLDDYKMESIDEFNYRGYGYLYQNKTYDEISITIDDYINRLLMKMKRNSLPIEYIIYTIKDT